MSYLGRIAARASVGSAVQGVGGAPAVAAGAVPSMVSRSPLVQFDQRLALPGFSEMASASPGDTAPAAVDGLSSPFGESATVPAGVSGDVVARKAEASAQSQGAPAAPVAAVAPLAAQSFEPGRAFPVEYPRAPISRALPSDSSRGLEEAKPGLGAVPELTDLGLGAFREPTDPVSTPGLASPISLEVPAFPLPEFSPGKHVAGDGSSGLRESLTTDAPIDAVPPADAVHAAIARLDAWFKADSHESTSDVLTAAIPAPRSQSPAESSEPTFTPTITIGKLEIEVVPPPPSRAPARNQASERRAATVSRASSSLAEAGPRAFGWRQR